MNLLDILHLIADHTTLAETARADVHDAITALEEPAAPEQAPEAPEQPNS